VTDRAALGGRDYIETLDWTTEEIEEALALSSELKEAFASMRSSICTVAR